MLTILSRRRRAAVAEEALRSRADRSSLIAAAIIVAAYNLIGLVDIYSTVHGLASGAAEEANPVIDAAMEHLGPGWIFAKLALQALISAMVLWFPHRIVLAIFLVAVAFNVGVVYSNLKIVGLI